MSDFDVIKDILQDYNVPDDVVMEIVREMWKREEGGY